MRIACVCVRARAPLRVDAYVRLARSWRPVRLAEVMTARAVMFVLLSVTIVEAVVAEEVVPLVLWHGIGGSCCDPQHLGQLIALIEDEVPGIYIHSISFGNSPTEDVFFSFYGLLSDQVSQVCDALANDTKLAQGFNAMGFGQGALFLRALVQRCGKVRVHNLISVGGPQQGSYGLPYCPGNNATLCRVVHHTVMKHGVYTPWVQKQITVAQYWQDPKYEETYKKDCIFLPDLNQMNVTNPVYKERILTLKNFVLVKLELDRVVNPPESEWFGFYKPGQRKEIYTLEESDIWKKDLLGLQKLNSTGRLHFISAPYGYLNITVNWFNTHILHYINGTLKTQPTTEPGSPPFAKTLNDLSMNHS